MAQKRMFSRQVIDSDRFLDMSSTAQALYFHLAMRADDDGFIDNIKGIMRNVNGCEDDLKLLIIKEFVIPFKSGIVVIRHWKLHNYIPKDRYTPTKFFDEQKQLTVDKNGIYTLSVQPVYNLYTQSRLGKSSIDLEEDSIGLDENRSDMYSKEMIESSRLVDKSNMPINPPTNNPTLDEVKKYCEEIRSTIDVDRFFNYYSANGWIFGKNKTKIKDWKAVVRQWEKTENKSDENDISHFGVILL